jgi:hypothetical protein
MLGSVACASATSCVAVGTDNRGPAGHAVAYSLAEMWNGSKWTIVPAPSVPGAVITVLNSVSCPGPSDCTAAGEFAPQSNNGIVPQTLVEHWDGLDWALVASP